MRLCNAFGYVGALGCGAAGFFLKLTELPKFKKAPFQLVQRKGFLPYRPSLINGC